MRPGPRLLCMPHRSLRDIQSLDHSLTKLSNGHFKHIILSGDFNCPDIDWENSCIKANAQDREVQQALLNVACDHHLEQVHDLPSRGTSRLDLVFTNIPSLIKSSTNVPGISDHDILVTDSTIRPTYLKKKRRKVFAYSKANWADIKLDAISISANITRLYNENADVMKLWDTFKTAIWQSVEKHVPSKTSKPNYHLPWLDRNLKRLLRQKQRLYNKAKITNDWSLYRAHQKCCKASFKRAEQNYVNNIITDGIKNKSNKPFWTYIKSKKNDNMGTSPLKQNGDLICDATRKAEILLNQFKSVFTPKTELGDSLPGCRKQTSRLPPLVITSDGVANLLNEINTSKASGPDNLPNMYLKMCAQQLAPALALIFTKSLTSGQLPEDWRNANVVPIFKKGNVHLAENYRPVSLTSVISKLLEHIVCKHLLDHLDRNNVLTHLNHGFRKGFSCETQLMVTMDDLFKQYDNNIQSDIIILDFSKAFDTVPHNKLLYKLQTYGIDGNVLKWITSFLTKRKMRVVVDGETSEYASVESGVPQGTVLGPLLFLCYINDLPDCVSSQVRLFADDCLLYRPIKNQSDHIALQKDLQNLTSWANTWGMSFNAKKCYLLRSRSKSSFFYTIKDSILQQVKNSPYLGVTISDDFKWSMHVNKITAKAGAMLGLLKRNLKHCPMECKKLGYISLVRSNLEYAASIWDPYQQGDIDRLEKVQRRAARFISGNYTSREEGFMTDLLKKLELPLLESRRKVDRLCYMYKILNNQLPAVPRDHYLAELPARRRIKPKQYKDSTYFNVIENQSSNNNKALKYISCKTPQYRSSFFPSTILDWNKLTDEEVDSQTLNIFRCRLTSC